MSDAFDVSIATHREMAEGSTDDRMLADALAAAGALVRLAVWTDAGVDWTASTRTVIRSTWDYHLQPAAWFAWLSRTSAQTRLINDPGLLRWNSDKRYLLDLARVGVAVVPTELVPRSGPSAMGDHPTGLMPGESSVDLAGLCAGHGWRDVVVKPTIGASAKGAGRFTGDAIDDRDGPAQRHLDALLARGDALVQPFQAAVEDERERSLVFLGGVFAHAFTKPPFLRGTGDGLGEQLHEASAAELALAADALSAAPGVAVYARVDVVPTPDGPRLMELELIEPDLGLRLHPPSIDALVRAILG